jgi:hypothetical protein
MKIHAYCIRKILGRLEIRSKVKGVVESRPPTSITHRNHLHTNDLNFSTDFNTTTMQFKSTLVVAALSASAAANFVIVTIPTPNFTNLNVRIHSNPSLTQCPPNETADPVANQRHKIPSRVPHLRSHRLRPLLGAQQSRLRANRARKLRQDGAFIVVHPRKGHRDWRPRDFHQHTCVVHRAAQRPEELLRGHKCEGAERCGPGGGCECEPEQGQCGEPEQYGSGE